MATMGPALKMTPVTRDFKEYRSSPLGMEGGLPLLVLDKLKTFPLFHSAPESFFSSISLKLKPLFVSPRQYIVTEGEDAKAMYWIIRGSVNVTSRDGESEYAELKEGAFFGEIGILFDMPRTATIIARTRCLLVVLSADALRSELPNYPGMERAIRDEAQERLKLLEQKKIKATQSTSVAHMDRGLVNIRETLQRLTLFQSLPADLLHVLGLSVTTQSHPPFSPIFRQNSSGREIYFIVFGTVEVVDEPSGKICARLGRGQHFGEFAWLSLAPKRTATVRSVTEVELLVLGEQALQEITQKYPQIKKAIQDTAMERMRMDKPLVGGCLSRPEKMETPDPDPFSLELLPTADRILLGRSGADKGQSRKRYMEPSDSRQSRKQQRSTTVSAAVSRRGSTYNTGMFADNILLKIFSHLPLHTLMSLRQVSRHWATLLTVSTELLTLLDLKPYNTLMTDAVLKTVVSFVHTRPREVDISNCFHITDEGFSVLVDGVAAGARIWRMPSVWEVSSRVLLSLSAKATGLEEIDLSNCRKTTDATLASFLGWKHASAGYGTPSSGCPGLRKLTLSYCKHISDQTMRHMATQAAMRLEELNLTRCTSITDYGFQLWGMTQFPRLSKITLADCTFLTDNAVVYLVNAARNLRYLDLSFCCALSDTAIEVLSLGCPALRHLNLAYCGSAVSDASLGAISLHLGDLEELSVRGCIRVTGISVEAIARGCGMLAVLDISQCKNVEAWLAAGGCARLTGSRIQIKR